MALGTIRKPRAAAAPDFLDGSSHLTPKFQNLLWFCDPQLNIEITPEMWVLLSICQTSPEQSGY